MNRDGCVGVTEPVKDVLQVEPLYQRQTGKVKRRSEAGEEIIYKSK